MKLELKNIKYANWASQETACYDATLYIDGQPFATVSNSGHGGADCLDLDPRFKGNWSETLEKAEKYCREAYKWKGYKGTWHNGNLEIACGELLYAHLDRKHYKKLLRQVCFLTEENKLMSFPKRVKPEPSIYDTIREARDDLKNVIFLNELSFDDAVARIKSVQQELIEKSTV